MDLELLLYFAIALVPGLFWLFLLALRYRPDREFRLLILKVFVLGMSMCIPAGFFNTWLMTAVAGHGAPGALTNFILFVFIVGPNEETMKFLIVWTEGFRKWRFQGAMDGIILATASALGFATYENATYMQRFGIQVLALRAWACALGHISFSAIFGYYLGLAKAKKYNVRPCVAEGLVLAALFHGLYDFLVGVHELAIYIVVPALLGYYYCLTRAWLVPYLSLIAPRWMEYTHAGSAAAGFQRRRFPIQPAGPATAKVKAALDAMGSLDEATRLSGIEAARRIIDQRVFERVHDLTHDPVDAVRQAADSLHKELKRKLREDSALVA